MALLRSQYRTGFENPSIEESEVFRIEFREFIPTKPDLFGINFYGAMNSVVAVWLYDSDQNRQDDLKRILKQATRLKME